MKRFSLFLLILVSLNACNENENISNEFTGNESTYPLIQGSDYLIQGTVSFKEKTDGTTLIAVVLSGTEGDIKHPVHLHLGNISTPGAEVAALLNPVKGASGVSESHLAMLADESVISYQQLIALNACIKVHLSDVGPDKNIILAAGNIGKASADDIGGRTGIRSCKSN
jgi:hypothetical protein